MHCDKKALPWFDLELKCQGHWKNHMPMPREQITCQEKLAQIGQLMCQIYYE